MWLHRASAHGVCWRHHSHTHTHTHTHTHRTSVELLLQLLLTMQCRQPPHSSVDFLSHHRYTPPSHIIRQRTAYNHLQLSFVHLQQDKQSAFIRTDMPKEPTKIATSFKHVNSRWAFYRLNFNQSKRLKERAWTETCFRLKNTTICIVFRLQTSIKLGLELYFHKTQRKWSRFLYNDLFFIKKIYDITTVYRNLRR